MDSRAPNLEEQLDRFERRLPERLVRFVRWLRKPSSRWIRIPAAIVLIVGGFVGFLPILGFWMIPLGLILVAQDMPFLRSPMARLLRWIDKKWPMQQQPAEKGSGTAQ